MRKIFFFQLQNSSQNLEFLNQEISRFQYNYLFLKLKEHILKIPFFKNYYNHKNLKNFSHELEKLRANILTNFDKDSTKENFELIFQNFQNLQLFFERKKNFNSRRFLKIYKKKIVSLKIEKNKFNSSKN